MIRSSTALEAQIDPANQTLKEAEANFRAARAAVRFNRASEAPTIGAAPGVGAIRDSNNQPYLNISGSNTGEGDFILPFDLDYEIDLWGRIRRTVAQAREQAQASAADLETSRLSLHAELALDYFDLRSADAQSKLLDDTVKAFQSALQLTEDRYNGGASPLSDVTQARTQLQAAQVQATDVDIQRASTNMRSPSSSASRRRCSRCRRTRSLSPRLPFPAIPGMLPSQLLERRPDIASDERSMAAANEQIGIAQAAYYPHAVALGSGRLRGHIRDQLVFVAEPFLRRRPHAIARRSMTMAVAAPPPTSPSRSTMAPLPLTARPRSPHSSRLRTT